MTCICRIADLNIKIDSVYPFVLDRCASYRYEGFPDLIVQTDRRDIEFERKKNGIETIHADSQNNSFSNGYLEFLAVYRKIAEKLPDYGGFVFHGSCVAVDGRGYVFTAKSGTGKSTHARLWRELLGNRAVMVNDDKPIIRMTGGAPFVFGTPWDGKEHLSRNISVPLQAICILERAEENRIREISASEALPTLIRQTYRPFDSRALAKTVDLLDGLNVKYYHLGCNMDQSAAKLSYHAMKEG